MKEKKPDQVVYNEESGRDDASLKPYSTNLGAPAITTPDTTAWKLRNIDQVNKQVGARYAELKQQYDALMEQFQYNQLVYEAHFNFEPIVGHTYHLYKKADEKPFLSIISPQECNFEHLCSFRLNADKMWEQETNHNRQNE